MIREMARFLGLLSREGRLTVVGDAKPRGEDDLGNAINPTVIVF